MARTLQLDLDLARGTLLERGTGKPPFIFCGDGVDVGIALFNNGKLVGTAGDTFTVTFKMLSGKTLSTANSGGVVITPTQFDAGSYNATVSFSEPDVSPGDHKIEVTVSGDNAGTFLNTCKFREPVYRGPAFGLSSPPTGSIDDGGADTAADIHVYYRGDGYNAVTGEWVDRTGQASVEDSDRNLQLLLGGAPTVTENWSNGRKAVLFDGTNVIGKNIGNSKWLASPLASGIYSVFIVGDLTDLDSDRFPLFGRRSSSSGYNGGIRYRSTENQIHHFKHDVTAVSDGVALSGKVYVSGEKFLYGVRVIGSGSFDPARDRDASDTGNCNADNTDHHFLAKWTVGGTANNDWSVFTGSHVGHIAAILGYTEDVGATRFGEIMTYFGSYYTIPIE